jgi:ketosteroid isomerase-like protein
MLIESWNTAADIEILYGEILREVRSMDDAYRINLAKTELREAYEAADVDRLMAVFSSAGFTDMSDGGPTKYGTEAVSGFRNEASDLLVKYYVTLTPIINRIVVLGNVAYDYGWHEFTLTPKNGGRPILKRQRYFELWNKDAAGNWRISFHMNNEDVKEKLSGCESHWFLNEEQSPASL